MLAKSAPASHLFLGKQYFLLLFLTQEQYNHMSHDCCCQQCMTPKKVPPPKKKFKVELENSYCLVTWHNHVSSLWWCWYQQSYCVDSGIKACLCEYIHLIIGAMLLVCIFLILIFMMNTLPSTYTKSYKSTKFCQQKFHLPPTHHVFLCVRVCLRECNLCVQVCTCICGGQRSVSGFIPHALYKLTFETGSLPSFKHTDEAR